MHCPDPRTAGRVSCGTCRGGPDPRHGRFNAETPSLNGASAWIFYLLELHDRNNDLELALNTWGALLSAAPFANLLLRGLGLTLGRYYLPHY
jgi:hypothetical protein